MARKSIAPTHSNYLRIGRSLEHARRGYELLERKRQILVMELMSHVEAARVAQREVREAVEGAFDALRRAALAAGSERLLREALAIAPGHSLQVRTRSVMGVRVSEVSFELEDRALEFGLLAGAGGVDEVRKRFQEALEPIVRLAGVENTVLRVAREVKRMQRRVNALENVFIPDYEEVLKYIGDSLEEREREDMVIMKKVKRMRESESRAESAPAGREERHG